LAQRKRRRRDAFQASRFVDPVTSIHNRIFILRRAHRLPFGWILVAVTAWSGAAFPGVAEGAPRRQFEPAACAGCVASVSEPDGGSREKIPLAVVLHGDGDSARTMVREWEPLIAPRGWALLAIACPASQGCKGSFWQWNGDPSWLTSVIDDVAGRVPIDRKNLWLIGWSGGASYIGYRTQEIEKTFAALVIHGGGIPPRDADCTEPRAPVYFLVGDRNPLHHLAVGLRQHYEQRCPRELVWDVQAGLDHPGERRALAARGPLIVEWLAARVRSEEPAAPSPKSALPDAGQANSAPLSSASPTSTATTTLPVHKEAPRRSGCACMHSAGSVPTEERSSSPEWLSGCLMAVLLGCRCRRRRFGKHGAVSRRSLFGREPDSLGRITQRLQ
jgi:predicted esterase